MSLRWFSALDSRTPQRELHLQGNSQAYKPTEVLVKLEKDAKTRSACAYLKSILREIVDLVRISQQIRWISS